MPDLVLHHCPNTRSATVRWMLEETGAPYRVVPVDVFAGQGRTPEHLALNPFGKVPVLVVDGVPMTEYLAIVAFLGDLFPEAGLAIPAGDRLRGLYLSRIFLGAALEAAMMDLTFPRTQTRRGAVPYGEPETLFAVLSAAVTPGPYLFGERFTAADVAIGSGLNWGLMTGLLPQDPALLAYARRLSDRPAARRARELDAAMGVGAPKG